MNPKSEDTQKKPIQPEDTLALIIESVLLDPDFDEITEYDTYFERNIYNKYED